MCRDHIVADVRRIREEIAAECGYDLKRLAERDREVAETYRRILQINHKSMISFG